MVWVLFIIVLVILLILIIKLARIYLTCLFTYVEEDPVLTIRISLLGITILNKETDFSNLDEENLLDHLHIGNFQVKGGQLMQSLKGIKQFLPSLFRNLSIHKFNWMTEGGTGEASSTGIAGGAVWAVKGSIVSYLAEKSNLKCQPKVHFQPYFQQECFNTSLECMVSIRLGKAIHAFLNMRKKEQSIRSK